MSGEEASEDELGGIADALAQAKEFLEVTGFNFVGATSASENSRPGKSH